MHKNARKRSIYVTKKVEKIEQKKQILNSFSDKILFLVIPKKRSRFLFENYKFFLKIYRFF